MAALSDKRMQRSATLKNIPVPLGAGQKVYQGGIACADTSAKVAKNAAAGNANLVKIGEWMENVDNSAGTASVYAMCSLDREIPVRWYDNATGANAFTSADFFADAYMLDDHTVTKASSGNSKTLRVWAVDTVKGVAVQATSL